MELSTTNGHITIDYLFIYQSSGSASSPQHSVAGSCSKQLVFTPMKAEFQTERWMFYSRFPFENIKAWCCGSALALMENFGGVF